MELRDFLVEERFGADAQGGSIADLENALKDSASGEPRLVVVHFLYEATSTHWGRGVGITPLLEVFKRRASEVAKYQILDFIDVRNKCDGTTFFENVLIEKILKEQEEQESWKKSLHYYSRSAVERLGMFIYSSVRFAAALVFSLVTAVVATVLRGGNFNNSPNLAQVLDQYQGWLWLAAPIILLVALIILLIWLLYFKAEIRDDSNKQTRWEQSAPGTLKKLDREKRRKQLLNPSNPPESILQSLLPKRSLLLKKRKKCLLLIIDDVDCIDGKSVELILGLFKAAEESEDEHQACVVLGYNPDNPNYLRSPAKEQDRELLFSSSIFSSGRRLVSLAPLEHDELTDLLCKYFDRGTPEKLIDIIRERRPEASARQLWGFFDKVLVDENSLETIAEVELLRRFDYYIHEDEIEVKQIIDEIKVIDEIKARDKEQNPDGGSLKLLKFMLASEPDRVPEEVLKKLLEKEEHYRLSSYEEVLKDPRVGLIEKVSVDSRWYYCFREPSWRYRISTSWDEWRRNESEKTAYSTKVFEALREYGSLKEERWNAKQALQSYPSKEAVELLYNQGLYYYKYQGQRNAGYALYYLGWEEGGALAKWLSLSKNLDGEELLDFLYWEPKTSLSPFRDTDGHKLMPRFSGPDLLLDAATAYWVTGRTRDAHEIIELWQPIREYRLRGLNLPEKYKDDFWRADTEIQLLLAKILFHRGEENDWKEAKKLGESYFSDDSNLKARSKARFIVANLEHYCHFATGRWLAPLRFEPNSEAIENLLEVSADKSGDYLTRLRALYSVCSAMWDGCFEKAIDPRKVISNGISEDNVRRERLDYLRQTVEAGIELLKEASPCLKDEQVMPPGRRRTEQAEMLFWKAVFLHMRCLLLAADVGLDIDQKRPALDRGEQYDRLEEFVHCGLFTSDEQNRLLGSPSFEVHPPETQEQLESLYHDVLEKAVQQATELFENAGTIYRWLSHRRGLAEVSFQRGLMLLLTGAELPGPPWQELLANSNRVSGDEIGLHLDRLYSHVLTAKMTEDENPLESISAYESAYESAKKLCSELDSEFQELVAGELAFRLGLLLRDLGEYHRGATTDDALQAMEEAHGTYREAALDRLFDIRWNLAELMRRKADSLKPDDESRNDLLNQATEHCNWIIRNTIHIANLKPQEISARRLEAALSKTKGDLETAIRGYESVIDYYDSEGSRSDKCYKIGLLAALLGLFETYRAKAPSEGLSGPELLECLSRIGAAAEVLKEDLQIDELAPGTVEKKLFLEACLLLGEHHPDSNSRRDWLFSAFDAYERLGLFGHTILLDDRIRKVLPPTEESALSQENYEKRLRIASEKIDGKLEEANWRRVYEILGPHFLPAQATAAQTPHQSEKRDYRRRGSDLMREKEFEKAISLLESGKGLIDLEEPEDVDFELLKELRTAYREASRHNNEVRDLDSFRGDLEDVDQSRNFLLLAKTYRHKGWEEWWALEIATDVDKQDSSYYRRAKRMLEGLEDS